MMKNGILTFLFAFCPGAGQMYQGYMKRGLSLITMFCVAFGAGTLLGVLYVAMPIVWMYSFFDTFNLRAQSGAAAIRPQASSSPTFSTAGRGSAAAASSTRRSASAGAQKGCFIEKYPPFYPAESRRPLWPGQHAPLWVPSFSNGR